MLPKGVEGVKEQNRQYRKDNQEAIKEHSRKYFQDNKEAIKEHNRKYFQDNKEALKERYSKKINCQCGVVYTQGHTARHKRSIKHINYMKDTTEIIDV